MGENVTSNESKNKGEVDRKKLNLDRTRLKQRIGNQNKK